MGDYSLLRLTGLVVGVAALVVAALRLRRHASQRTDVVVLVLGGLGLLAISIRPSLVNIPAEAIALQDAPSGRLLTLLLASSFLLWPLLLLERSKSAKLKVILDESIRGLVVREFLDRGHALPDKDAVWVVIPVLNEADNLRVLLPKIPDELGAHPVQVLVIDDGSTDDSAEVAREHGALVVGLPVNRGGGAALKLGFRVVRAAGGSVAVTMDGDGQHKPDDLAGLVEPILNDEADLIIGSRVLGSAEYSSAVRAIGIRVFNVAINVLMSTKITDCSSGYRAVRVRSLEKLQLVQEQYHTAELIIEAAKHNLRIGERPISIVERMSGKSKKGTNLLYGAFFLRTILKTWLR